ncbi:MAG: M20 family metallopeptidase [Syntrophaceae bacterium]|nr:M20 family metallopeptidase [Syntrophaceae bacterium]
MADFLESINPDDTGGVLRRMIRSKSLNPPGDVRECGGIIAEELRTRGLPAEIVEEKPGVANVVSHLDGKEQGQTLIWNGHFDVVTPGEDWQTDPFGGEYKEGFIYGRGASDMKSGVAAMIIALGALRKSGSPFKGRIVFQAVGDEETGSDAGTRLMIRREIGAGAEFAIVSEPTNLNVAIGNRGLRWLEVSVKGRASHAGRPHVGANAINAAARMIHELERLTFRAHHPLFEIPHPSLSVTMIQAGSKVNIIPERCTFSIDRRMMPGESSESIFREIEEVLQKCSSDGISTELRMTHEGWDPYAVDPSLPWVKKLCAAVEEVTGQFPQIKGKAGCTDASHLYHHAKIPSVCFGPGLEDLAHKANERVALEKVVQAAKVYALSAVRLLS